MPDMREEFEDRFPIPEGIEWRDTDYFPVQTDNVHVYVALAGASARYTSMWKAWQASRAALRVEDEIDRLKAENEDLRGAVEQLAEMLNSIHVPIDLNEILKGAKQ
ncbi:hypothetical protein [Pseudomonas aeruginosa]|uniref:hypothetical protein n=1 Tax=Pseudomonas aeruginosa TaxID=287 RepID=UPI002F3EC8AA